MRESRLCSQKMQRKTRRRKRRPPMPELTPIPIFAPVLRPLNGVAVGVTVGVAVAPAAVGGVEDIDGGKVVVVDAAGVDVTPVGVDAAKLVLASHVFAAPLVEIIVKFPPFIPCPWLARFGYK